MFGIIHHHERNFHLYFERKARLALFTLSASFAAQKLSFIDHATIFFFRSKSVLLTVKHTQQNHFFFCLLIVTFMRTWSHRK